MLEYLFHSQTYENYLYVYYKYYIANIFEELESFESAPDLLFVYHFMYNSNSLNIRNECIHGREYVEGEQLKFAFKVTLLALYMIKYRIKLILNNKLNN